MYLLFDDTKDCVVIDPGCYTIQEKKELTSYIEKNELNPVRLLNTHCHIDHILGNHFISEKYNLKLEIHEKDLPVLRSAEVTSSTYGIRLEASPEPGAFLKEGTTVEFGNSSLEIFFTPGHSPGSIAFYASKEKFVVSGDVLFHQSIGRYDLPGANLADLKNSLHNVMMKFDDDVKVYSGHGPETTIGYERAQNPFLQKDSPYLV